MTEIQIPELSEELERIKEYLTLPQIDFCTLILSGMKIAEAWQECGLATGDEDKDRIESMRLYGAPRIRMYMDEMRRQRVTGGVMTLAAVNAALSDIAMVDALDVLDVGGLTQQTNDEGLPFGAEIQTMTIKQLDSLTLAQRRAIKSIKPCAGGVEVKMYDKMDALKTLAKHLGVNDKVEVNHTGNVKVVTFVGDNGRGDRFVK